MKTRNLKTATLAISLVLVLSLFPQSVVAVGWEDSFDDGTYEPEWTVVNGSWSASDTTLKAIQDVWWGGYHAITHECTDRRASRIFDFNVEEAQQLLWYIRIYPLAWNLLDWGPDYAGIGPSFGIGLEILDAYIYLEHTIDNVTTILDTHTNAGGFDGWHTINFTLGRNYNVTVDLDGERILSALTSSDAINTPELFYINAMANVTLDNIAVILPDITTLTDTTPTDTTTTDSTNGGTTPPPINTTLIAVGAGVAGFVILAAVVFMRRR